MHLYIYINLVPKYCRSWDHFIPYTLAGAGCRRSPYAFAPTMREEGIWQMLGWPNHFRWLQGWRRTTRVVGTCALGIPQEAWSGTWKLPEGEGWVHKSACMMHISNMMNLIIPLYVDCQNDGPVLSLKKESHCSFCRTVQSEFLTRVVIVRERMSSKEQEITGKWMTEEKLKGEYTPHLVKKYTSRSYVSCVLKI